MPVEIIPCATVREADGLAMSSRNMRLTPEERSIAPKIYRALQAGALMIKTTDPVSIKNFVLQELNKEPAFTVDYVEIADDTLLQPVKSWDQVGGALIFTAVFLGNVRLIDNIRIF
jgi:pantoate--beta-alanine ligase